MAVAMLVAIALAPWLGRDGPDSTDVAPKIFGIR
jgi:hypothetical protein